MAKRTHHHEPVQTNQNNIAQALVQMFIAAIVGLFVLLVFVAIVEWLATTISLLLQIVGAALIVGIFAFYAVNVWTLAKTNETKIVKTVEYRNSQTELQNTIALQQLQTLIQQQPIQGNYSIEKPVLVRTKQLRKRAPQLPHHKPAALEHDDDSDDDNPLMIPDNVVRIRGDDEQIE